MPGALSGTSASATGLPGTARSSPAADRAPAPRRPDPADRADVERRGDRPRDRCMPNLRVPGMNIVRASFYSGIATAARLVAGLVVIKLVAWFAGPEGVGRLGQFMSLMSLLAVLAGGGSRAGRAKYVAESRGEPQRLSCLLAAARSYALCASCLMGLAALVFSRQLAIWILGDASFESLVRVLALAQLGIAAVNYVLAVINGFMDVRRLAFIQVIGSVLGIALAAWLASRFQLYGALLALVLGQLAWLVVALPSWWRSPYFRLSLPRLRFDREMNGRLAAFSLMTISSALLPPLVN